MPATGEAMAARARVIADELCAEQPAEALATALAILADVLTRQMPPSEARKRLPWLTKSLIEYFDMVERDANSCG